MRAPDAVLSALQTRVRMISADPPCTTGRNAAQETDHRDARDAKRWGRRPVKKGSFYFYCLECLPQECTIRKQSVHIFK